MNAEDNYYFELMAVPLALARQSGGSNSMTTYEELIDLLRKTKIQIEAAMAGFTRERYPERLSENELSEQTWKQDSQPPAARTTQRAVRSLFYDDLLFKPIIGFGPKEDT